MKQFKVDILVNTFRNGLKLLTPLAEEVSISWKDSEAYDDWDAIVNGLFEGFILVGVRSSDEFSKKKYLPLSPYDMNYQEYASKSYVAAVIKKQTFPLIRLKSFSGQFDTCNLGRLDNSQRLVETFDVAYDKCNFCVVMQNELCSDLTEKLTYT